MEFCRKQVKNDCEELLKRFQHTDSVRYEVFSNIWKEMNFSSIFYGTVKREKRAFSRVALDTATPFFVPPFSFQIRVGGLYLLSSLFYSQTASPPQPIRVSLKDWEEVKKFEKDAIDAQHFDVVFTLRRLKAAKAFHFTAMPTLLTYARKKVSEKPMQCEEFMETASRPQGLITIELLEELSNIGGLYQHLKKSVMSESVGTNPSINLTNNDLVPQLRSSVLDFYNWQQKKANPDEDVGEGTSSEQSRAVLIASIKSKAYGQAGESMKSRRHRQVEVDFTSNESGPSGMLGTLIRQRKRLCSLKAKTDKTVHITGDLWKEATSKTLRHLSIQGSEKAPRNFKSWMSK